MSKKFDQDQFEEDLDLGLGAVERSIPSDPTERTGGKMQMVMPVYLADVIPNTNNMRTHLPVEIERQVVQDGLAVREAIERWIAAAENDDEIQAQIDSLIELAASIDEYGQIQPATGMIRLENGERRTVLLETGHRRFFGLALKALREGRFEKAVIQVSPVDAIDPNRQEEENKQRLAENAVNQAARFALGMGEVYGFETPDGTRFARALAAVKGFDERFTKGDWEKIEAHFDTSRVNIVRHLDILRYFEEDQLARADRAALTEYKFRGILAKKKKPREMQAAFTFAVRTAMGLPAENPAQKKQKSMVEKAAAGLASVWNKTRGKKGVSMKQVAAVMKRQYPQSELQQLRKLLEELLKEL
jgi:hypothetical protein